MNKPIIFLLDDDPQVLRAVRRDMKQRYQEDYKIMSTNQPQEALEVVTELKKKGDEIALFLVDQRMPDMVGDRFLAEVKSLFPKAKKVLLTAYSDTDAAIRAINVIQLDFYLTKPWDPPEEKLFPVIDDLLDEWVTSYRPAFKGIKILGYQYSPLSHELKDFLSSNLVPFQWLDVETSDEAKELMQLHDIDPKRLPSVSFPEGDCMPQPSIKDLADRLGFNVTAKKTLYDTVIIGAGPSGLASAVYGGSEGLKTLLIEKKAPGGQAGSSSRIENYLGFPKGLSGQELTRRAITQAKRFGIEFLSPKEVKGLTIQDNYKILTLEDGQEIKTKSVIISTGVAYRKLPSLGIENFTGAGIYYGSSMSESQACRDKEVYIVGGGNSAGQAAVYLSNFAKNVYIVIRKPDLSSSMSSYLIDQIDMIKNIQLVPHTTIAEAKGDDRLDSLVLSHNDGGTKKVNASALFIFIGNRPYTDWVHSSVLKNDRGFILTGRDLLQHPEFSKIWKLERPPFLLETSIPGVFASGDVRAGAMNRVASSVGEGSMAIKFVHEYLTEI